MTFLYRASIFFVLGYSTDGIDTCLAQADYIVVNLNPNHHHAKDMSEVVVAFVAHVFSASYDKWLQLFLP